MNFGTPLSRASSAGSPQAAGLANALDRARSDETVVVWKLDRIGRSLQPVFQLVNDLRERSIGFRVLTGEIDTKSSSGRPVLGIFAALAAFERDLIHERTMAAARARGQQGERPSMITKGELKTAMTMMAGQDNAAKDVAEQLGVSLSTLTCLDGKRQPKLCAADLPQTGSKSQPSLAALGIGS